MRIIAETIGRPLRFEDQPREDFREQLLLQGVPAPAVDHFLDGLATRDGKTASVQPTFEQVTGRPAVTYAQWVAHRAAEFDSAPA